MKNKHFIAILKDGTSYAFDNMCNTVDYKDEQLCIFKNDYTVLAMIPYAQIKIILNITGDGKYE